jgi:hypothetical protein
LIALALTCRKGTEITDADEGGEPTTGHKRAQLSRDVPIIGEKKFSVEIFSCAAKKPPRKKYSNPTAPEEEWEIHPDIELVGNLEVNLSQVDLEKYRSSDAGDGKARVPFCIEQSFGKQQGMLLLRATIDGIMLGEQEVNFQKQGRA